MYTKWEEERERFVQECVVHSHCHCTRLVSGASLQLKDFKQFQNELVPIDLMKSRVVYRIHTKH